LFELSLARRLFILRQSLFFPFFRDLYFSLIQSLGFSVDLPVAGYFFNSDGVKHPAFRRILLLSGLATVFF